MGFKDYLGIAIYIGVPAILYLLAGGGAESYWRGP